MSIRSNPGDSVVLTVRQLAVLDSLVKRHALATHVRIEVRPGGEAFARLLDPQGQEFGDIEIEREPTPE